MFVDITVRNIFGREKSGTGAEWHVQRAGFSYKSMQQKIN
jgi:hypothetical protein